MEIEKILDAGSGILEDVMTAVETNQYQNLGKKIQGRVAEATDQITAGTKSNVRNTLGGFGEGYSSGYHAAGGSRQAGGPQQSVRDPHVYTGTVEPTNKKDGIYQTNYAQGGPVGGGANQRMNRGPAPAAGQRVNQGVFQGGAYSDNQYRRFSSQRQNGPAMPNSSRQARAAGGGYTNANRSRAGYQRVYGNAAAAHNAARAGAAGMPNGAASGAYRQGGREFFAPTPFNSKNVSKNTGLVPMVFGSIGMAMGGVGTIFTGLIAMTAALGGAAAAVLLGCGAMFTGASGMLFSYGKREKNTIDAYYQYGKYVGSAEFFNIKELAAKLGMQEKKLRKNLKKMMQKGLLPKARMDDTQETLLLTDSAYEHYRQAADSYKRRQEEDRKRENYFTSADGDETVKQLLREGSDYLKKVRRYNELIPAKEMSEKLTRLENIMYRIFEQVKKKPDTVQSLRKFMEYYLPTTEKLLSAYLEVDKQPQVGDNITNTKKEIEEAMDTINDAFEKLLDSLFEDLAWDISSDISVMKTMLMQDGLTGGDPPEDADDADEEDASASLTGGLVFGDDDTD